MGGKSSQSLAAQASHPAVQAHSDGNAHAHGPSCNHGSKAGRSKSGGMLSRLLPAGLLSVLGLDLYTKGKAAEGMQMAASSGEGSGLNPFDQGLINNCRDFWSTGRTLGVDYADVSLRVTVAVCNVLTRLMKAIRNPSRRLQGCVGQEEEQRARRRQDQAVEQLVEAAQHINVCDGSKPPGRSCISASIGAHVLDILLHCDTLLQSRVETFRRFGSRSACFC